MDKNELYRRLEKNLLFKELILRKDEYPNLSSVIELIMEVGDYSIELSKTIIMNMPEFTLHDENHIFNMLYLTEKLVTKENIKLLSSADIMMIILAVFIHDIGMAPPRELVMAWKGQLSELEQLEYKDEVLLFQRFRKTCVRQLQEVEMFNTKQEFSKAQLIEDQIITEYIRRNHANRARKMIAAHWGGKIKFGDTDLTADLADICFSHNESYTTLLNMETVRLCDDGTILCIPFVAVILRLTDIIDFDSKRTPPILFSHLTIKNPISLREWVKHISVNAWSFDRDNITFSAHCTHPAIEATIRNFCDLIDEELRNCTYILANLHCDIRNIDHYKIRIPACVNRSKIGAVKDIATGKPTYTYHDTKFTLNKKQVVDLLMGTQLYGKPEFALRELIQNSIDACLLRKSLCDSWNEEYTPHIRVLYKTINKEDFLIVEDNGIGMNQHIVDSYYTNLGQSYYTSTEFYDLLSDTKHSFKPISKFGIGILSCFMVCDSLEVETKRLMAPYQSDESLQITIDGFDSLFVIKQGKRIVPGTQTILRLRETHPWLKMNKNGFVDCVKNLIPLPPFNIDIETDDISYICSPDMFEELDLNLERDFHWESEKNIKIIEIDLNDEQNGFRGKAEVAFIVNSKGEMVNRLDIYEREVVIDDTPYEFSSSITYGSNCINKISTNIDVDEDGIIDVGNSYRDINYSDANLSIHGIDVPARLFNNFREKTVFNLPMPIRLRLDVGLSNDLNLNSSRTQIIYDELWLNFEKSFYKLVCTKIKDKVGNNQWNDIKDIFSKRTLNDSFKEATNSIK